MSLIVNLPAVSADELVRHWLERQLSELTVSGAATLSRKPGQTDAERAALIYARMTSHRFCKQRPDSPADLLAVIESAIRRDEPIPCILGHGPLKNPNNCPYPHADWAEFFAYNQLMRLDRAVREFHAPGLSVTLYLDDGRSEYANGVPDTLTHAYRESVRHLVESLPFGRVIHNVVSMKGLYEAFGWRAQLEEARQVVRDWEIDPAHAAEMAIMTEHALKNLPGMAVVPDAPDEFTLQRAQEAAHRYRVAYEAEKRCGFWSQPDRLYLRYSPHAGFYQIFTLRRGSVSQPWQGHGVLHLLNGLKPDPAIMTRSRQSRLQTLATVSVPEFAHLPGLQSLPVLGEAPAYSQPPVREAK